VQEINNNSSSGMTGISKGVQGCSTFSAGSAVMMRCSLDYQLQI
jgi:hypothetical protein